MRGNYRQSGQQFQRPVVFQEIEVSLPEILGLVGGKIGWTKRGTIKVFKGGKAPKRRFQPGSFIRVGGQLFLVVYAYRLKDNPSEWLYACEYRNKLVKEVPSELFPGLTESLQAGSKTPRIFPHLFRDALQAHAYFADIPLGADRKIFTNGMLVKAGAKVVIEIIESVLPAPKVD
ncbi:MAG TPA: hypothetical protein VD907_04305 [Verrucomicrobiae bacterium]|nr:hypothetical protein [Verrucomicrobiae bacterium]